MHVVKRGARGLDIVRDEHDRRDFAQLLFLLNDTYSSQHWRRDTNDLAPFERPAHWPERCPLVKILAWTLMPNHFHIILQLTAEGGMAKFMQRLCGSMSLTFNAKYGGTGSIFQGGYKGRVVENEADLRYLTSYVLVKNVFELLPGGLEKCLIDFDSAWKMASEYPYSSFSTIANDVSSPIVDIDTVRDLFPDSERFKRDSYDMIKAHLALRLDNLAKSDFANLRMQKIV